METLIEFFRKNVNGKTLYTDTLTYSLDGGRLKCIYSDQISFSNMFFFKTRCTIDMFIISKEKIIDTKEEEEVSDSYSSSLFRYSLAERLSTGEITGTLSFVTSSLVNDPVPMESVASGIYGMSLKNNELKWIDDQILYRDGASYDGKNKPISFKSNNKFFFEDGKLVYEREIKCFDVNPKTLEKVQSDSYFPIFVSRERRV